MQQSTLVMWLGLTWRLILTFLVCPAMGQASASATSSSTFMRAITDPTVSLILIPPDNFELIPEEWCVPSPPQLLLMDCHDCLSRAAGYSSALPGSSIMSLWSQLAQVLPDPGSLIQGGHSLQTDVLHRASHMHGVHWPGLQCLAGCCQVVSHECSPLLKYQCGGSPAVRPYCLGLMSMA